MSNSKVNFLENGKQPEWSHFQSSITEQQEGPGHEVYVIFFDVRKALIDSIPYLLLDQLQVIDINPSKWISSCLTGFYFTVEGEALDIKITRGVWRSTGKL